MIYQLSSIPIKPSPSPTKLCHASKARVTVSSPLVRTNKSGNETTPRKSISWGNFLCFDFLQDLPYPALTNFPCAAHTLARGGDGEGSVAPNNVDGLDIYVTFHRIRQCPEKVVCLLAVNSNSHLKNKICCLHVDFVGSFKSTTFHSGCFLF